MSAVQKPLPAFPLGQAPHGFRGRITAIAADGLNQHRLSPAELESRLLELGFAEGVTVEILHQGGFGRDPIAVRINHNTIALRRSEAMAVFVL